MDGSEELYIAAQPIWLWLNFVGLVGFGLFVLSAIPAPGALARLRVRRLRPKAAD